MDIFSVLGMDNFGGMNNMDRFGSSGMGRMNGKEMFCDVSHPPKQAWNTATFLGHF